jgi:hypothetical protein
VAYQHIKIHPVKQNISAQPYQSRTARFNISSSSIFPLDSITKILKPVNAVLNEKAMRHLIYLDDGRVIAVSQRQAEEHIVFVYDVLQ